MLAAAQQWYAQLQQENSMLEATLAAQRLEISQLKAEKSDLKKKHKDVYYKAMRGFPLWKRKAMQKGAELRRLRRIVENVVAEKLTVLPTKENNTYTPVVRSCVNVLVAMGMPAYKITDVIYHVLNTFVRRADGQHWEAVLPVPRKSCIAEIIAEIDAKQAEINKLEISKATQVAASYDLSKKGAHEYLLASVSYRKPPPADAPADAEPEYGFKVLGLTIVQNTKGVSSVEPLRQLLQKNGVDMDRVHILGSDGGSACVGAYAGTSSLLECDVLECVVHKLQNMFKNGMKPFKDEVESIRFIVQKIRQEFSALQTLVAQNIDDEADSEDTITTYLPLPAEAVLTRWLWTFRGAVYIRKWRQELLTAIKTKGFLPEDKPGLNAPAYNRLQGWQHVIKCLESPWFMNVCVLIEHVWRDFFLPHMEQLQSNGGRNAFTMAMRMRSMRSWLEDGRDNADAALDVNMSKQQIKSFKEKRKTFFAEALSCMERHLAVWEKPNTAARPLAYAQLGDPDFGKKYAQEIIQNVSIHRAFFDSFIGGAKVLDDIRRWAESDSSFQAYPALADFLYDTYGHLVVHTCHLESAFSHLTFLHRHFHGAGLDRINAMLRQRVNTSILHDAHITPPAFRRNHDNTRSRKPVQIHMNEITK